MRRRGGSLGLGEAADVVDRLVERATDAWLETIAGGAQVGSVEDQAAVRATTTHGLVGVADGLIAPAADIGEGRARRVADSWVGNGTAADEGAVIATGIGIAGGDRSQVEASKDQGARDRARKGRAHWTIFSIGRTRIPDAPAALSRGSRPQTSSAPTTEWMAIMPGMRERDDRRRFEGGEEGLEFAELSGRRIHHQVLASARGDHGAEHRVDRGEVARPLAVGGRVGDEDRLRLEDVADLAQAVHHQRRAGRHEVDDALGQAEPRRDLDGARDRDDLDRDAAALEEATRRVRVGGGDPEAGQVLDRLVGRVVRDGGGEPATAVAEGPDLRAVRRRSRSAGRRR